MAAVMRTSNKVRVPRDSSRQAEGLFYGRMHKLLNRWSGFIILGFVGLHLLGVSTMRLEWFGPLGDRVTFLQTMHYVSWVRAVLFAAIAFHFLHGLKLIALEMGMRVPFRVAFWTISGVAAVIFVWEMLSYVGI